MTQIVIIGGGHAAAQAITSLRQKKFDGKITLISEEASIPYQRPPLSKAYLAGDLVADRLPILRETAYEKSSVNLMLGVRAEAVNAQTKSVTLANGDTVAFDKLLLATGGRPRKLTCPGAELDGLHYIRTAEDTDRVRPAFEAATKIVIVGGGYIGLEIASVARRAGKQVTVLEAEDRILARVVAPEVSAFYADLHTQEGVDIRTQQMVTCFEGDSHIQAVLTEDGSRFEADLVIAGIGLIANKEIAQDAGLDTSAMGIMVNSFTQTSNPDIYAVGDVAWYHNEFYDRDLRLESVQNAVDQTKVATAHMLGDAAPYDELPWFWSDQYGLKLQIAGLSAGYDTVIERGSRADRSVAFFYLKDGKLIAADCVGRMAEFMQAKKLIRARVPIDSASLQDDSRPFKEIAAAFLG